MSSQYYSATAYVGTPHRNAVEVTIPLVGPQGPAGEAGAGAVESVNGQTGVVVLAAANVGAAATSHTHAAADITSGTLNIGRIPTGTGSTQVALGNHTHTLSAITDAGTAAAQDANQDLGTGDQVTFQGVTVNGPPVNEIYPGEGVVNCGKLNLDTYAVDLGGGSTGDGFPSIVFGALNGGITLKGPEGDITTSKVINIPNASGTIALTQQSSDMEITDSTKGIILKSANNTRWRITINDDGTLSRAALALMTLLAFATSGMAQVRDMVTDTNGNIITGRTNELTFTNNLRFTPLTNANSRTAIIGTNGVLTAGNPPSAAAANGALLTADGAGGSSFVESRTQFSRIMSATSRSNWTNNDWNFAVNDDTNASLSLAANTIYRVTWNLNIQVATNTLSWGYTLAATATFITNLQRNGTYQFRDGSRTVGWETSAGQSTAVRGDGGGQILEARTNMDRIVGGSMVVQTGTNAATLYFRWWPGQNTNQPVSLGTNSWLHAEKLN
jgi:hypothetical protein